MSKPECGDFKGDGTITVAELCKQPEDTFGYVAVDEIRLDKDNVIVLPDRVVVHRMPSASPYVRVERTGTRLCGKFHGLSDGGPKKPKQIEGGHGTHLIIEVADGGYYYVWGEDLEQDLQH